MDAEKPVLTDVPVMEISLEADTNPEADVVVTPTIAGEVVTDGEKSKAGKKLAKAPRARSGSGGGTGGVFVGERAMDAEKPVLTDVPVMEISLEADTNPEADVVVTPTIAGGGEVVTDGEKSKAGKKLAKAPRAKLLSQYSQNPHHIMRGHIFTVGRRGCDLSIKDQYMPSTLSGGLSVATLEIGLEEDDEIHEEILTFVTTNHQGQQFITNQHHKSNGVVNQPTPPNFGDEEQSRKRYVAAAEPAGSSSASEVPVEK
ncbi:hypothetical protein DY000_02056677 [Brassica cretica]|uniref:Uncharacterized protein n=1 Tax=Brassica cretica TaxID=69181 RepID=A0ABQ7AGN6_BRACR|nr:hypothetical protein DY000_02056677 [Brassica cretica]